MATVNLTDNSEEIKDQMSKAIEIALEKCGLIAEGYAKKLCPVDTGNLRNSISHAVSDNVAYIGTNVEYAAYVEMGTTRTRAQPYLKPAVMNNLSEYKQIIDSALKNK